MLESIFDVPLIITGPIIVGSLCLFAIGGLLLVRRHVLPRLRIHHEDAHFSGAMVHSVMVFYGLALALIAVNVFETYADVSKIISQEATALAVLYRDVSAYPEPIRSQLQKELRDYVDYVIQEAWPLQQRGQVPSAGVERMNHFQSILVIFEPATEGQKLLHAEALRAYNNMVQARRLRLDAVSTGLPGVMWGRGACRRGHQPERLLLFPSRRCALARHLGNPSSHVHGAGYLHDLRPRPSIPGRFGSSTRSLSTDLRPPDETIARQGDHRQHTCGNRH